MALDPIEVRAGYPHKGERFGQFREREAAARLAKARQEAEAERQAAQAEHARARQQALRDAKGCAFLLFELGGGLALRLAQVVALMYGLFVNPAFLILVALLVAAERAMR